MFGEIFIWEAFSIFHVSGYLIHWKISCCINRCWRLLMIKLWKHNLLDARTMDTCNRIIDGFKHKGVKPSKNPCYWRHWPAFCSGQGKLSILHGMTFSLFFFGVPWNILCNFFIHTDQSESTIFWMTFCSNKIYFAWHGLLIIQWHRKFVSCVSSIMVYWYDYYFESVWM
jgi:hypothetical protein